MANLVIRLLQQLIPPLLLSYFYFAWKIATFEVGPNLISNSTSGPIIGYLYVILPSLLIVPTTLSFLRLYFLPSVQSVPPLDPPLLIQDKKIIFECLSPAEAKIIRLANDEEHDDDEPLVERCYKGECGGRWKPARTRHCNTCERCRGGWDHHCPICFDIPLLILKLVRKLLDSSIHAFFLALLLYTLPTVTIISLPLYKPLWTRCREAYTLSWTNEYIRQNWWEWRYSWIVAGGPIGRYAGGTFLGWKELDKIDEDSILRLNVGLMVLLGIILALISAGLAYTTISLLIKGNLTIDRGRSTAHNQALMAIRRLQLQNQSIPAKLEANLAKFSDQRYFFVPLPLTEGQLGRKGKIVETLPHERPYDHGLKKNLHIVLGRGWKWILPWNALRRGMDDEVFMWPIQDGVERRLREEAQRRFQEGDESR